MPVNEKTRHRRVLRKPSVWGYLGLLGNSFETEAATEYQPSLAAIRRTFQAKSRLEPCYRWPLPMAHSRTRSNWKHVDVVELVQGSGRTGKPHTRPSVRRAP